VERYESLRTESPEGRGEVKRLTVGQRWDRGLPRTRPHLAQCQSQLTLDQRGWRITTKVRPGSCTANKSHYVCVCFSREVWGHRDS
jgi:hypothetical protein